MTGGQGWRQGPREGDREGTRDLVLRGRSDRPDHGREEGICRKEAGRRREGDQRSSARTWTRYSPPRGRLQQRRWARRRERERASEANRPEPAPAELAERERVTSSTIRILHYLPDRISDDLHANKGDTLTTLRFKGLTKLGIEVEPGDLVPQAPAQVEVAP